MNNQLLRLLLISLKICSLTWAASTSPTPLGRWMRSDSSSIVEIRNCDHSLCGQIIWLKEPNDKNGIPWTDTSNPDPKLQTRAIMGLMILQGLSEQKPGVWKSGTIYDPNSGHTYSCRATLDPPDKLILRGYFLSPLLGQSETWNRVNR
jgi:uncharacterized protein (DUF2147 family)